MTSATTLPPPSLPLTTYPASTRLDAALPFLTLTTELALQEALKLSGDPKPWLNRWIVILKLAHEKKELVSFETEVLHRIDRQLFINDKALSVLERVFSSSPQIVKTFLSLATSYQTVYYDSSTFLAFLADFSPLAEAVKERPFPILNGRVPCYNQNGKKWINRCLQALKQPGLSVIGQPWTGAPFNALQKRQIAPLAKQQTRPLSFQPYFNRTIHSLPVAETVVYREVEALLNSQSSRSVFTESDRVHLLRIISYLNGAPSSATSKQEKTRGNEQALIYLYQAIKEGCGESYFTLLSNPDCYQANVGLEESLRLLQQIVELANEKQRLQPSLSSFYEQRLSFKELASQLDVIQKEIELKKNPEKPLEKVIEAFSVPSALVRVPLNSKELTQIVEDYKTIEAFSSKLRQLDARSLACQAKEIQKRPLTRSISRDDKVALLSIGLQMARLKFGFYPNSTQILAVLGIINFPVQLKGRIGQALTGEGKTILLMLIAFYYAIRGFVVHVHLSNRYLARLAQEEGKIFLKEFNLSSSDICADEPMPEQFKARILFGAIHDFQFPWMWDSLELTGFNVMGEDSPDASRPPLVALIDEIDLLIDTGLEAARIAIPGNDQFKWTLQPIASFVKDNREKIPAFFKQSKKEREESSLIQDLRTLLTRFKDGQFKEMISTKTDFQLENWIKSAYAALFEKRLNQDYVIKPVEEQTLKGKTCANQVVIVDKGNTGRLKEKSRYQNTLHEHLELKHGDQVSVKKQSLTAASICHPVFFNHHYAIVCGLTGTMGTDDERKEMEELYHIDSFDIPPHKTSLLRILEPIVTFSSDAFFEALLKEIREMEKQERPILFGFLTIEETEAFSRQLAKANVASCQSLNERQPESENFVVGRAGFPGMKTIATGVAGRGTNIILHPKSRGNGGLHVVLTFDADPRAQRQFFGRAARQGQPGSARVVLCLEGLQLQPSAILSSPNFQAAILQELDRAKQERIKTRSIARLERSKIETINHPYLLKFLEGIKNWQKTTNDFFLQELEATIQSTRLFDSFDPHQSSPSLEPQDLLIYQQFLSQRDSYAKATCLPLLHTARATLKLKIQQQWALFFYGELDDLYQMTNESAIDKNTLLPAYQKAIEDLYQAHQAKWNSYLMNPKEGFYNYLKQIIGK